MPPLTPEQKLIRQTFIGGSDAASICGVNPYRSAYDVFLDKIGQGKPVIENEAMRWGHLHEATIAEEYATRSGRMLAMEPNAVIYEGAAYIGCHIDRKQHDIQTTRDGVVEIKSTRKNIRKGECPDHYVIQLYHNLICTNLTWGTVVILIQGSEMVWYDYHLTPKMKQYILDIEGRFWKAVEAKDWNLFGVE